jgi:hypothetical protein
MTEASSRAAPYDTSLDKIRAKEIQFAVEGGTAPTKRVMHIVTEEVGSTAGCGQEISRKLEMTINRLRRSPCGTGRTYAGQTLVAKVP